MNSPSPLIIPRGDKSTWEQNLDVDELNARIRLCREPAPTTRDKGQRLEDLMVWLLPHIPGFQVRERNVFNSSHSQEIDIAIWNEKDDRGFPSFGERIIVECKNWERPVDSSDIAWFYWKMRLGGVQQGFMIAAQGVTSDPSRHSHAQAILTQANADMPSRQILVLTLSDIEKIDSRNRLRDLLIDKSMKLTLQASFS